MDPLQTLEQMAVEAPEAIGRAATLQALEEQRVAWLGRKSRLTELMKVIPTLPAEQRGAFGKRMNEVKQQIEARLAAQRQALSSQSRGPSIDVTLPGAAIPQGRLHPITHTIGSILSVFTAMGFEVIEGPEMEFEHYNFDALNIPREHPSREAFDTFFVDAPASAGAADGRGAKLGRPLLRSHTSPVQVRVMEKRQPPLRIVVPGKVYRPDSLDPSHSFMFHQVEGLMVDDRTSFADLKGVLEQFVRALFGDASVTRFRPHFFPFTEPSAEVDLACAACRGRGCSTCGRKGWLEILGCGMVHPNVFKAVGYDPARVQGFAFGMGVERIAMLKHGITDIRLFFENDLRFLEQF
jgi:phenylalanyl-tRNA synthetase alpha chain